MNNQPQEDESGKRNSRSHRLHNINTDMQKEMTFVALYREAKNRPTPAQEFIEKVAALTKKTPQTVRQWIYGQQIPDELTQSIIANHFNVPLATLFSKVELAEK